MQIRFDHGPETSACEFVAPKRLIVADTAGDVLPALAAVDAARAEGAWVAGYLSYEAGYALEPRLWGRMPEGRNLPLVQFGVYDGPEPAENLPQGECSFGSVHTGWDAAVYQDAFDIVHEYICAGDIYQANLTFPLTLRTQGQAAHLYARLAAHQPTPHGALIAQADLPDILCRSPELFFRTDQNGQIETRPMKGTQPRSNDPAEDARRLAFLAGDEKNRAENLMIVDLLRNDLSRVSQAGTVRVPELFAVESYATVHQMTSLVQAQLQQNVGLSDIMQALFPCGSITGAPKIRAMEILSDLEDQPRDIYCGSIGWAAPDGRSEFNVAIRTLLLDREEARFNVGGGVVYDSTAAGEYEEAEWKARFVQGL